MEQENKNFHRTWFKFYGQDWLTDVKIISMSMEDRLCFITLLCLASASSEQGVVRGVTEEAIINLAHIPDDVTNDNNSWQKAKGFLVRLEKKRIVTLEVTDDVTDVKINAFERRQNTMLTGAERQAKYIARKKEKASIGKGRIKSRQQSDVGDVSKVTLEERRGEKKREDKKEEYAATSAADPLKKSKKYLFQDSTPMDLQQFLEWCKKSKLPHMHVISEWAGAEKPKNITRGQWSAFISRNARAAMLLVGFSDDQLQKGYDLLQADIERKDPKTGKKIGFITRYTLETLGKYLLK